jgi:hypothetical protein
VVIFMKVFISSVSGSRNSAMKYLLRACCIEDAGSESRYTQPLTSG